MLSLHYCFQSYVPFYSKHFHDIVVVVVVVAAAAAAVVVVFVLERYLSLEDDAFNAIGLLNVDLKLMFSFILK